MGFGIFGGSSFIGRTPYDNPITDKVNEVIHEKIVKPVANTVLNAAADEFEKKTGIKVTDKQKKWSFEDNPKPGTHIRVRRAFVSKGPVPGHFFQVPTTLVSDSHGTNLYEHHGIYIGDGKVIHFAAPDGDFSMDIKIRETTLGKFKDGGELEIRDFDAVDNDLKLSNDEIVQRAKNSLERQDFGSYNLLTNNCEHFANYCVFGKKFSEQAGGKEAGLKDLIDKLPILSFPDILY